jgi:hypothetical protein
MVYSSAKIFGIFDTMRAGPGPQSEPGRAEPVSDGS